jgi:hypothetical protein
MNEPQSSLQALPPKIPDVWQEIQPKPLGETPDELEPIPNTVAVIESALRQPRRLMCQLRQPAAAGLIGRMVLVSVACSLVYGLVLGTFSMHQQLWMDPLKVAGGFLVACLICVPSLYILACLSGSSAGLSEVCGLVSGMLMITTLLLVGLAPVAWLFSESTESLNWMGTLHLAFLGIALIFGLRFLAAGFRHSRARTNAGVVSWALIFLLVVLQMTTTIRPLVGPSTSFKPAPKQFFLSHWMDGLKSAVNVEDPQK